MAWLTRARSWWKASACALVLAAVLWTAFAPVLGALRGWPEAAWWTLSQAWEFLPGWAFFPATVLLSPLAAGCLLGMTACAAKASTRAGATSPGVGENPRKAIAWWPMTGEASRFAATAMAVPALAAAAFTFGAGPVRAGRPGPWEALVSGTALATALLASLATGTVAATEQMRESTETALSGFGAAAWSAQVGRSGLTEVCDVIESQAFLVAAMPDTAWALRVHGDVAGAREALRGWSGGFDQEAWRARAAEAIAASHWRGEAAPSEALDMWRAIGRWCVEMTRAEILERHRRETHERREASVEARARPAHGP